MGIKHSLWGWKAIVDGVKGLISLFWKFLNPNKNIEFELIRKKRKSREKNKSKFKKRSDLIIDEVGKKLNLIFNGLKQLPRELPFIRFLFKDRKISKKSKNSSKTKNKSTNSKTAKNKSTSSKKTKNMTKNKSRKRANKKSKEEKTTNKNINRKPKTIQKKNFKPEQQVTPVAEIDKAGQRLTIYGRINKVKSKSKKAIQQQGLIEDNSGKIRFTLFADAGYQKLKTGKVYGLENVFSNKYENGYAVEIDDNTHIFCLEEKKSKIQEENIENISKKQKVNKLLEKESLTSAEKSFKLFLQDKTISEIAEKRNLKETTIYGHLIEFVKEGKIKSDELIDSEKKNKVENYLKENELLDKKQLRLKPIKEKLPDAISYDEIKCVLAEYGIN